MESAAVTRDTSAGDVHYIAEDNQFQVMVDGKLVDVSALEAAMLVLMQRYITMSDVTAEKTREMQDQVNQIKEANVWLNRVTTAALGSEIAHPDASGVFGATLALIVWMDGNGLDKSAYVYPLTAQDFKTIETQISNYVDQLSSNNDLRMLSLKTAVNKSQQALTAADGILQNIKQLMQTIISNLAR